MKQQLQPEVILEQAEKFFNKQNFQLAKKMFEQYPYGLLDSAVTEKITKCNIEINRARAKTLLKKSKKLFKKHKNLAALELLKEAYELSGDDAIKQRIDAIAGREQASQEQQNARQAATDGNYTLAAELYKKLFTSESNLTLFICLLFNTIQTESGVRKVKHLLKKHGELLGDYSLLTEPQAYQLGYIYYKIGKFATTSKLWQPLARQDASFIEQKNVILALWEHQLFKNSHSVKKAPAFTDEVNELLIYKPSKTIMALQQLEQIKQAEELFQQQKYRAALKLLLPFPNKMSKELFCLYAGIYYHIVKYADDVTAIEVVTLCELWQNAIYNPLLSGIRYQTPAELADAELKNRRELIKINSQYKTFIEYYLNIINNSLQHLKQLFSEPQYHEFTLTPFVAMLLGKTQQLATIYREQLAAAKLADTELLPNNNVPLIYCNEIQQTVYHSFYDPRKLTDNQQLIAASKGNQLCEQLYLNLAIMAYCTSDSRGFEQFLLKTGKQFYSDELFEVMLKLLVPDELKLPYLIAIDKIIAPAMKKSKNSLFCKRCSEYSLQKIMLQYEDNLKKSAVLSNELKSIFVKLNEDIPKAYMCIFEGAEVEEIAVAFGQRNIQRASKIAQESVFDEVKDFFFLQIGDIVRMVVHDGAREDVLSVATKFYPHCRRVDPEHEITLMLEHIPYDALLKMKVN